MLHFFKTFILKKPRLFNFILSVYNFLRPIRGCNNVIKKKGVVINCKFSVRGNNNIIIIEKEAIIRNSLFHIIGDNNRIIIGPLCKVYDDSSFWVDGVGNMIQVGKGTTIRSAHLCAQEENTQIIIGENCMLSNTIEIRTSDSHSIKDIVSLKRINPAKSVNIGDNVWIAAKATVMKGVTVGSGSVIGYRALVTKTVPENVVVAGSPAEIVRENIVWSKEL